MGEVQGRKSEGHASGRHDKGGANITTKLRNTHSVFQQQNKKLLCNSDCKGNAVDQKTMTSFCTPRELVDLLGISARMEAAQTPLQTGINAAAEDPFCHARGSRSRHIDQVTSAAAVVGPPPRAKLKMK